MKKMFAIKYYSKDDNGREFNYIGSCIYDSIEGAIRTASNPPGVNNIKAEILPVEVDEKPANTLEYVKTTETVEVVKVKIS